LPGPGMGSGNPEEVQVQSLPNSSNSVKRRAGYPIEAKRLFKSTLNPFLLDFYFIFL